MTNKDLSRIAMIARVADENLEI